MSGGVLHAPRFRAALMSPVAVAAGLAYRPYDLDQLGRLDLLARVFRLDPEREGAGSLSRDGLISLVRELHRGRPAAAVFS